MTALLIVLAAAAPFAFWLLRRQARNSANREGGTLRAADEGTGPGTEISEGIQVPANPSVTASDVETIGVTTPDETQEAEAPVLAREGNETAVSGQELPAVLHSTLDDAGTLAASLSPNSSAREPALTETHLLEKPQITAEPEVPARESDYASLSEVPPQQPCQDTPVLDNPEKGWTEESADLSAMGGTTVAAQAAEREALTGPDQDTASNGVRQTTMESGEGPAPAAGVAPVITPEAPAGSDGSATGAGQSGSYTAGTADRAVSADAASPANKVTSEETASEPDNPRIDLSPPSNNGSKATAVAEPEDEPSDSEQKPLPRYQPPGQKAPRAPNVRTPRQQAPPQASGAQDLDIRVHLTFDRSYFCSIGLLPERFRELEGDVDVTDGKSNLQLLAQEDWYEDLYYGDIGERLRRGVELKTRFPEGRQARWLLTGRDVYVLASHPRASAYVSTARLALGRADVVLCVAELVPQAEAILAAAGVRGYIRFDESHGAPRGWVGFRGVLPTVPLPLDLGADPFYALKPAPDIQIELEGGLRLRNSVYIAGYAPRIKLYGQHTETVKVLIDGSEAQRAAEGAFVSDGYDTPGPHTIYCEGLSCSGSYSIEEPPESWEPWPAYSVREADLCGPLVHPNSEVASQPLFSVPMSNPLLIGSEPGQVFLCPRRRSAHWKGFVPFEPVWALPAQPLICDKRTSRILQFHETPPAQVEARANYGTIWSTAILDAARKGLRIEGGSAAAGACWGEYKRIARNIRKGRR